MIEGIYNDSLVESDYLYGHCAKLIGWGEENGITFWQYANTWGRDWGEFGMRFTILSINKSIISGFFRVVFDDLPEEVVAGLIWSTSNSSRVITEYCCDLIELCTVIRRAIKSPRISPRYHLRRINWKTSENSQVANGNKRFWLVWSFHKEGNLWETSHLSPSQLLIRATSPFYLDDLHWLINSATLLFSLEWFIHRCEG